MEKADKELLKKAFNAGRDYQRGENSEYHGGHEHSYPDFQKWLELNTAPDHIVDAINYIRRCESDLGFMGSPEYYEKKKMVDEYNASFNKTSLPEYLTETKCCLSNKELDEYLNGKKQDGYNLFKVMEYNKDLKTGIYLFTLNVAPS